MIVKELNRDRTIISFTAFLNFMGLTLAFPVFIPLMSPAGGLLPIEFGRELRGLLLGFLLGLYPLAQFFAAPVLGVLSDRLGRKPVLLFSALGNMLGNVVLAAGIATHELWVVVLGRLIAGCFSGSLAVTQSAMSDISTPSTLSKNFGVMGAMMGGSLALGPAIGGVLSDHTHGSFFTLATPFVAAATLSLVNFALLLFFFVETLSDEHRQQGKSSILTGPRNFIAAFSNPNTRTVFLVVFLLGFGFTFFSQFFQYYLIERFAITNTQFGMLFGYIGVWAILAQGLFNRPISKRYSPHQVLKVTLFALSLMFPIVLIIPKYSLLYAVVFVIPIMNGLSMPNITAIVSGLAEKKGQGQIMGVNQAVQAVSMLIPPLVGGYLVGLNYTMPLWVAFVFILSAWFVFLFRGRKSTVTLQK